jgi:EAL domain-containing protein (putative c-di-GMP-specific phosphodiesterase class I)
MTAMLGQAAKSMGRLLVVENDLVQRTLISKIGEKLGYETLIASSFEAAAALLRQQPFDIMTLDLSLGERDGVELLRLVADIGLRSMPIVIISACDERIVNSAKRVAKGLKLSLNGCITKPLDLDRLKEALYLPHSIASARDSEAPPINLTRERITSGLARAEFFVEFQPKVDLRSGKVVGAEALARWRTPELGLVSPELFIPMAEQFGLMPELTDQILSLAIKNGRRLVESHPGFTIAVNVSASLMSDLTLPDRIEDILRSEAMAASALIVEITEGTAMSDVARAMDILVRLRIKNIGAAIDDFGTGYSSLSALARLPFSELKIDQSFVKGCKADPDMMKIVDASVALARAFNMKVVVEGVDHPQVLARMRQAGCDVGQGYLFARSLELEHAEDWIARHNLQQAPTIS